MAMLPGVGCSMNKETCLSSSNVYEDARRAEAYATLKFPGTYYLAYRDLPAIIAEQIKGRVALDFGCGAGRSTAFLKRLGFEAVGIDVSASMIELARKADPDGSYELVDDGDFSRFQPGGFDLVLCAFAFDSIPRADKRAGLLRGLRELLTRDGRIILLGSTPEIYTHEWASFSTHEFPQNRTAKSGETVRIVIKDVADQRPVEDFVWFHEDYLRLFAASGLNLIACHKPLGRKDEPYQWQSELSIAPWAIYTLGSSSIDAVAAPSATSAK
jgi:SAM-dependent methyltransferase